MTNATGEYSIAVLSDREVQQTLPDAWASNRKAQHEEWPATSGQGLMTEEVKPLRVPLKFSGGTTAWLNWAGSRTTSFWRVIEAIKRLAQLERSWDSYDAKPLNPRAVYRSFTMLPTLLTSGAPEPAIVPTRLGGLQFEWHQGDIDLEVKVPPSGPITHFFADGRSGNEREWEGSFDREEIARLLTVLKRRR